MKTKLMVMVMVAALVMVAGLVQAATIRPMPISEEAHFGATHLVTVKYSDLTEATANTAQSLTNLISVAAKQSVELVAMMLVTPWAVGNTNYTDSCLLEVGDGTDSDLYLTSTELASDGTEVFLKFGRSPEALSTTSATRTNVTDAVMVTQNQSPLTAVTALTTTLSYLDSTTNPATMLVCTGLTSTATTYANCTNLTVTKAAQASLTASTSTDDSYGRKVYTAADYVDLKFTPDSNQALDDFTAGEVRIYLRIRDAR